MLGVAQHSLAFTNQHKLALAQRHREALGFRFGLSRCEFLGSERRVCVVENFGAGVLLTKKKSETNNQGNRMKTDCLRFEIVVPFLQQIVNSWQRTSGRVVDRVAQRMNTTIE